MKFLKLFLAIVFVGVVTASLSTDKQCIDFKDGEIKFKKWLDDLYKAVEIPQERMKKVKKFVDGKIEEIRQKIEIGDSCFTLAELRGSSSEGLKVLEPKEFDYVLIRNDWTKKISYLETSTAGFAYAFEESETCLNTYVVPNSRSKEPAKVLDPVKVRQHMLEIVLAAVKKIKNIIPETVKIEGPAINFKMNMPDFGKIDIDLTLAIPQPANSWPKDARKDIDKTLKERGVGLVAKVLDRPNEQLWQITFSAVEVALWAGLPETNSQIQKKVLKIVKYLKLKKEWPCDLTASYHLKTLMMQMNHDPTKSWDEEKIVNRINDLICGYLDALKAKNLPSFFMPGYNLLAGKPSLTPCINAVENTIKTLESNNPDVLFPNLPSPKVLKKKPIF